MASGSTYLFLAMLVVVGSFLICSTKEVSGQCGGSLSDLRSQCSQFVLKPGPRVPPSAGCCAAMKKFNVTCACTLVTENIARRVSIEKVVFVGRCCGMKLPPGMHCGAVKIPEKTRK